ncbi:MAG: type II toxin-antitoxin system RelE/ParE family toxin [Terriglobia bacterium]|jgi:hypothetical protein
MGRPRVFKTKWFQRFARKEEIEDAVLLDAVERAERGQIDANLGGGVIKQRIARPGQGRSGGYRTIIVFQRGDRAVFMYGFAKSARANIRADEEKEFKEASKHILALTERQVAELIREGDFIEVKGT